MYKTMRRRGSLAAVLALAAAPWCVPHDALALDNGLARTPPMGWNPWNCRCPSESSFVRRTADAMVSTGLRDAGYTYVNLDCEWNGWVSRSPTGEYLINLKPLGDYIHSKGMKFGVYTDAGATLCCGGQGSYGRMVEDAATWASWGVDYVKVDWCGGGSWPNAPLAYTTMRDAIRACDRPIVLSICEWGSSAPWLWADTVGNLWRIGGDIDLQGSLWDGVLFELDRNATLAQYAGPGHWNDPDMMLVGHSGLTIAEQRAHFSLWCILAAPLLIGCDLITPSAMTPGALDILLNTEAIAVNQDSLGIQGTRIPTFSEQEVWTKRLRDGSVAVVLFNRGPAAAPISFDFDQAGVLSGAAYVRDLWAHADLGLIANSYSATVPSHDVVMLTVTPGPDTVAPRIAGAYAPDPHSICLYFSERLDTATARSTANYAVDRGGSVQSVSVPADRRSVVLTLLSPLDSGAACRVTVSGVKDAAGNAVAPNTGITVVYAQDGIVGITRIRYCPRQGWENRMVGGVFEGTNGDKDGGPYQTLHTITVAPPANAWTEVTSLSNSTSSYRCLRYRSPNGGYCNVNEVEFYCGDTKVSGTLFGTPGSWEDLGNDFTKAFDGDITTFFDSNQPNGSYTGIEWRPADTAPVRSVAAPLSAPRQRVSAVAVYDLAGRRMAIAGGIRFRAEGPGTAGGVLIVRMSNGTSQQRIQP
jgi:alpha-galactosidase